MQNSEIKEAESSILQLQNSLQTTSKNIQLSKELIQELQESYHSVKQQHSTSRISQSLHLKRSKLMTKNEQENNQRQDKWGKGKEREFGKIKKSRRLEIIEAYQKECKQNQEKQGGNKNEGRDKKIERNFSVLSNQDRVQIEEEIYKVSISKYENSKIEKEEKEEEEGERCNEKKNEQMMKKSNNNNGNLNKIRYEFDTQDKKKSKTQREQQSGQQTNRYYKFRFNTQNTNDVMIASTPIKKVFEQSERFNPQTQRRQRSKNRRPIFEKKSLFQSFREQQIQNYESRFSNIKQKLRMTESLIEANLKKKRQRQLQQKITDKLSKIITKTKPHASKRSSPQKISQRARKQKLHSNKNSNSLNSKLRQKSKSSSPTKNQPSHHHTCSSHQKPTTVINYFSKSNYYLPNPISCNKYKKQLQKQTRQRYFSQASKIPGVDRCFTYSQIYQFYLVFRKMQYPQYKWLQFLFQKVKTFGYHPQPNNFGTTTI